MSKPQTFLSPERLLDFNEIQTVRVMQKAGADLKEIALYFRCLSANIDQSLWLWFGVEAAATRYKPDFES